MHSLLLFGHNYWLTMGNGTLMGKWLTAPVDEIVAIVQQVLHDQQMINILIFICNMNKMIISHTRTLLFAASFHTNTELTMDYEEHLTSGICIYNSKGSRVTKCKSRLS